LEVCPGNVSAPGIFDQGVSAEGFISSVLTIKTERFYPPGGILGFSDSIHIVTRFIIGAFVRGFKILETFVQTRVRG